MPKDIVRIMDVSKRCQRSVVHFLTAENLSANEICRQMQNVYDMQCISRRLVFRLRRKFRSGRSSTDDNSRQLKRMLCSSTSEIPTSSEY